MALTRLITTVLALLGILACAQIRAADSADCTGVVMDENGVPIGAAQIKLEHVTGQTYGAETDGAGRFTLRNLLAGDYRAEVRKQGFFLLSGKPLTLHAGSNELTFTLDHAQELHEQVQVAAPANQIDTRDTGQRSTLTARDIRDVPVPSTHVLAQSLIALPEIVRDNRSVMQFTQPPQFVQRILFGLLAPIARLLGYQGSYPEYLTRKPSSTIPVAPLPLN